MLLFCYFGALAQIQQLDAFAMAQTTDIRQKGASPQMQSVNYGMFQSIDIWQTGAMAQI